MPDDPTVPAVVTPKPTDLAKEREESLTPLQDAINKIPDNPGESFTIGVAATEHDQGVIVGVDKDLGKGWWVGAEGGWWRRAGGYVAAKLGWSKAPKP